MAPIKRVLIPERLRRVPAQFSWVDQRLVRDRHIERCDAQACALYLFLVTVADAQGLSYYCDAALASRLSIEPERLAQARTALLRLGLVAYERPLYQVLALDACVPAPAPAPTNHISAQQWRTRFAELRARLERRR